jgi:mannose-1-phosphate guanylyltransferase
LKAILLAGGLGTRAKPFTEYCPKVMFPLNGRPVIDYVVRFLAHFSLVTEIIIVCAFDNFGKQIINYFEGKESIIGKSIIFIQEKNNGTGRSLLGAKDHVGQDKYFLLWFADNLCALKLDDVVEQYKQVNTMREESIGIVVVRKRRREETGRVILENRHIDDKCRIKSFMEKNIVELEQPEALGIYLFSTRIFQHLQEKIEEGLLSFNLSSDILVQLPKSEILFSYDIGDEIEWIDAESPAYIDRNKDIVEKILLQMDSVYDIKG